MTDTHEATGQRNSLPFKTRLAIYNELNRRLEPVPGEENMVRWIDPTDTDERVAHAICNDTGVAVTGANIKSVRRSEFGKLQERRFEPAVTGPAPAPTDDPALLAQLCRIEDKLDQILGRLDTAGF